MNHLIFLVEDDPQQAWSIAKAIRQHDHAADIEVIETESEFYERLNRIPLAGPRPDIVICDVMLPWTFPSPDASKPPPEVKAGTFRKAGLRCWARFRTRPDLRTVPWVYFTVLDANTIELPAHSDEQTSHVQKFGPLEPLIDEMRKLLGSASRNTPSE